jgi:Xaa-Pro aminopeptidase
VGIDPTLFSANECRAMETLWTSAKSGITNAPFLALVPVNENLVDQIWASDQPAAPCAPAFVLAPQYAGVDVRTKLATLRAQLADKQCDALLVSALDEVAWLFNIRGADIDYNPVVIAYAIVTRDTAILYVDARKISAAVRAHLTSKKRSSAFSNVLR